MNSMKRGKPKVHAPITDEEKAKAIELFLAKGGAVKSLKTGDVALDDDFALNRGMARWKLDLEKKNAKD